MPMSQQKEVTGRKRICTDGQTDGLGVADQVNFELEHVDFQVGSTCQWASTSKKKFQAPDYGNDVLGQPSNNVALPYFTF